MSDRYCQWAGVVLLGCVLALSLLFALLISLAS